MKFIKISVLLCGLSLPFFGFAWGTEGHHIAGEIAARHLNKKAQKKIAAILGDESIAIASNWADFIRSDTAYKYLDSWHYIDIKDSLDKNGIELYLKGDTGTDVYTKITYLAAQLKNKILPQDTKRMYLKLLIHFVEDVNQPMHTIETEKGGNGIKVLWFNDASNLHRVWDSDLILFQQLSYTEYANAIDHASKDQLQKWQNQPLGEWIGESYEIAKSLVAEIKQPNQKLSFRYNFDHLSTVNEQLLKSGIHLAQVLNNIFG